LTWILDAPEEKLSEDEKKTKKKLTDSMKKKLKKRGLDEEDLAELNVEGGKNFKLESEELDWLLECSEEELSSTQKVQKKKLVDVMKKKLKGRSFDDDDELLDMGVQKRTTFRLDSDELDWVLDSSPDALVESEKVKKKRLTDIMKRQIKKREITDEDLEALGISDRNAFKIQSEELTWILDVDEDLLNDDERKKKKKLVDIMKKKLKSRDLDEDELKLLGVKSAPAFLIDSDGLG
jgi:formylmethanofuran dehydrogenase subunit D